MPTRTFDYRKLLRVLLAHRTKFIVVGGVAAVLHGAPLHTSDLDVVHDRTPENIQNLLAALAELEAVYRERPERRIRPTASHLASAGHQLLLTKFGALDLLGTLSEDRDYDDLLNFSKLVNFTKRRRFHLLDLDELIVVKKAAGRVKDKAVLPLLRSTLDEIRNQ